MSINYYYLLRCFNLSIENNPKDTREELNLLLELIVKFLSNGKRNIREFNDITLNKYFEDKKLTIENIKVAIGDWDIKFGLANFLKTETEKKDSEYYNKHK